MSAPRPSPLFIGCTHASLRAECAPYDEPTNLPLFPREADVLLAMQEEESYEGSAFVLWRTTDGQLWLWCGSHCSCNSYSEDWEQMEALPEAWKVTPEWLAQQEKPPSPFYDHNKTPENAEALARWEILRAYADEILREANP